MSQLQNRKIVVFGISADTVQLHRAFARSERLNFPLLADPQKKTIQAYGALGPKELPLRVTYIIGPDGTIRGIDGHVHAPVVNGRPGVSRHGEHLALLLSDWKAHLGASVPNFTLPNYDGKTAAALPPGNKAAVIVFLGTRCPYSRAAAGMLRELAGSPIYRDVSFLGITARPEETAREAKAFAEEQKLPFPLARDVFQEVTPRFGPAATPSVWVLDEEGKVRYRGALAGSAGQGNEVNYVRETLDALLTGRPVPVAETPVQGTPIARKR